MNEDVVSAELGKIVVIGGISGEQLWTLQREPINQAEKQKSSLGKYLDNFSRQSITITNY